MKLKAVPLVGLAGLLTLAGCVAPSYTVVQDRNARPSVSEASSITRGHLPGYRAPLTIENAHLFEPWAFRDFQSQFVVPLQQGPWRYVMEAITLDAASETEPRWRLIIALDTGARVTLEDFEGWTADRQPMFAAAYGRTLAALRSAQRADPALDRYIRFWAKRPKPQRG
jgi:hypothetical protein